MSVRVVGLVWFVNPVGVVGTEFDGCIKRIL